MKNILCLVFSLVLFQLSAQEYSYISDRIFLASESLYGYDFKPSVIDIPNDMRDEIDPGDYSFGITARNLYVEGEGIRGVYSINNIMPAEYGYKIAHMNARDARVKGHLKVILNNKSQVAALIFKRSKEDPEIIFELPEIEEEFAEIEDEYFTDINELKISNKDTIWGTEIYPFFHVYSSGVQQRLFDYDSTRISFREEIKIEEKVKKVKPKKKKNKKEDTEEGLEPIIESEAPVQDSLEVKTKVTKTYFLEYQTLVKYQDGTEKVEKNILQIEKINEREDETAAPDEERFQLEIINNKKMPVYLYLNGRRQVSSMEIGQDTYLMRGF